MLNKCLGTHVSITHLRMCNTPLTFNELTMSELLHVNTLMNCIPKLAIRKLRSWSPHLTHPLRNEMSIQRLQWCVMGFTTSTWVLAKWLMSLECCPTPLETNSQIYHLGRFAYFFQWCMMIHNNSYVDSDWMCHNITISFKWFFKF